MNNRLHRYALGPVEACLFSLVLICASANADLVGTDEVVPAKSSGDRDRVRAFTERPEVVKELQAAGVSPEEAQARVRAMSDAEVHAITQKLDQLPAGGRLTDFQIIVIILLSVIALALLL